MAGHTRRRHGGAHGGPHGGAHGAHGATPGAGRAEGWLTQRVLVAGALVVAALLLAPWLAGRVSAWAPARALAVLVALPPALYHWFRSVQRVRPRTAAVLAIAYGILAAGIAWALTAA
jgi:hypothetical protein